ncbi:MAG: DUF1489 family protein [Paracoccaceae bacterium]
MPVNLLKLSVGTASVAGLAKWQRSKRARGPDGAPRHVTRMWPRREAEILDGGSIYWVIKGVLLCRQRIVRLDEVTRATGRHCGLVLDPDLIRVAPVQRKPFQGWRYLEVADAPPDLLEGEAGDDALPPALRGALADIGVL